MLGLLIVYFFGKSYYDLAKLYGRNAWGYAMLGSAMFLGAQFIFGFLIGILILVANLDTNVPSLVMTIASIAFSAVVVNMIEKMIRKNWEQKKSSDLVESDLLDN